MDKAPSAFRTISEVAGDLDVPQHVLRFWESRFHEIRPMKRGGGRRFYRPQDVDLLRGIRHLLYGEGYTIRGVQRILRDQGQRFVQSVWQPGAPQPTRMPADATSDEESEQSATEAHLGAPRQSELGGEGQRDQAMPRDAEQGARAEAPMPARATPSAAFSLPQQHVRKLQAALDDLAECRRLLDAAHGDRS